MPYPLEVVRSSQGLMGSKITVQANTTAEAYYDSFFGPRRFYLAPGQRLTIKVKGRDWQRGDTLSMSELVHQSYD